MMEGQNDEGPQSITEYFRAPKRFRTLAVQSQNLELLRDELLLASDSFCFHSSPFTL